MNKILKRILIVMMMVLSIPIAHAKDVFYVNNAGVEMTKEEYDLILSKVDEELLKVMPQDMFDKAINNIDKLVQAEQQSIYVMSTTIKDSLGNITTQEEKITEEEYNNFVPVVPFTNCSDGKACWETNAKKIALDIVAVSGTYETLLLITNGWKTMPNIKSFDVIGMRWETSDDSQFLLSNYEGYQHANDEIITYSYNGTNSKHASNGVGISMNIVDSVSTKLVNQLAVYGKFSSFSGDFTFTVKGTYQHATSTTTLAQSQSYNFNSSSTALGGVLNFTSSSIRNKYDGMSGISYSYKPTHLLPVA